MKERYIDERTGIEYTLVGDYYLPFYEEYLELESAPVPYGKWGQMRKDYLLNSREIIYSTYWLDGTLTDHLCQVDSQAREMYELLEVQMKKNEGVTEDLKAADQMAWVRAMYSIRNRAEEIVKHELVFV